MKGKTIVVPNYVSQTCGCIPARYEDKSVCDRGSRWEPGQEDLWGTATQCESCDYRMDIPFEFNTQDPEQIQLHKDIRVTELQIAYYTKPREIFK
ncbi:MAG: hypothetical protein GOV02_01405 [Candidatus Aenigmarchaeota archaeon]|nr:hypothetical protein [Candidatus Aenigmarchaeota archaeon]